MGTMGPGTEALEATGKRWVAGQAFRCSWSTSIKAGLTMISLNDWLDHGCCAPSKQSDVKHVNARLRGCVRP